MIAYTRNAWVSYLRVSTPEQAEKDLSIPAQRNAVAVYAERNGKSIERNRTAGYTLPLVAQIS